MPRPAARALSGPGLGTGKEVEAAEKQSEVIGMGLILCLTQEALDWTCFSSETFLA